MPNENAIQGGVGDSITAPAATRDTEEACRTESYVRSAETPRQGQLPILTRFERRQREQQIICPLAAEAELHGEPKLPPRTLRTSLFGSDAKHEFEAVRAIMGYRATALRSAALSLSKSALGPPSDPVVEFRLATTDLFVEKAQAALTRRAFRASAAGTICLAAAIVLVVAGATVAIYAALKAQVAVDIRVNMLLLKIFQATAIAGFFLAGIKVLVDFGFGFFHEGSRLRDRRHALRFGRLYVYMRGADPIPFDELREAFRWNLEAPSAFERRSAKDLVGDPLAAAFVKALAENAKDVSDRK
jgi:hypothetical protein